MIKIYDGKLVLKKLGQINRKLFRIKCQEQYDEYVNWKPKEGDIICSTYQKTGQTMLLQIINQVRSKGEWDETQIIQSPWPFISYLMGTNLNGSQKYSPRCFKNHNYISCFDDKYGAKHIGIIRNPESTLYSFREFLKDMPIFKKWPFCYLLQIDWFAWFIFFDKDHNVFDYYTEYWKIIDRHDFMLLCYEDVVADPVTTIKMVSKFMGVELTDKEIDKVKYKSSREYMLEHISLFNGASEEQRAINRGTRDLLPLIPPPTVTTGEHQKKIKASQSTLNKIDQWWKNIVEKQTGIKNYEEMRQLLKQKQQQNPIYQIK